MAYTLLIFFFRLSFYQFLLPSTDHLVCGAHRRTHRNVQLCISHFYLIGTKTSPLTLPTPEALHDSCDSFISQGQIRMIPPENLTHFS